MGDVVEIKKANVKCGLCGHKDRTAVDRDYLAIPPISLRKIAEKWGVHRNTAHRHKAHVQRALVEAAQKTQLARDAKIEVNLIGHIDFLYRRLLGVNKDLAKIQSDARERNDVRSQLAALGLVIKVVGESREGLKFLAESLGKFDPKTGQIVDVKPPAGDNDLSDLDDLTDEEILHHIELARQYLDRRREQKAVSSEPH